MNFNRLNKRQEIGIHIVLWILFFLIRYFSFSAKNGFQIETGLFSVTGGIVFITTFYFDYLVVFPKVFKRFSVLKLAIGILTSYALFIALRYVIEQILTNHIFNLSNYFFNNYHSIWDKLSFYTIDNLYFGVFPLILSFILFLLISYIKTSDLNAQIAEEKRLAEVQFLKAQVNPHFIFNTLNNIYSMVHFKSPNALKAIEKLSEIMRFTTYEVQKEKVTLQNEINYIQAHIQLEELRQEQENFVHFVIHSKDNLIEIPPFLLSPLVENALKHGEINKDFPIEIQLNYENGVLNFLVKNKIAKQKKDKQGGVGLENLKKRLKLLFPNQYTLEITEDDYFKAKLELQL